MKKRIAVHTADNFLFQKILLDAPAECGVSLGGFGELLLVDIDTAEVPDGRAVTMSRRPGADIQIPFPLGKIGELLSDSGEAVLSLSPSERCVYLYGERIKLTEVEYSLLSALALRGGGFATRCELLSEVWGGEADSGIINVYIHYLREKLEVRGEKIILSSRKCGYKIDEKYLKGDRLC